MGGYRKENGFTVVEMVVTLVVLSLFLTLFFQLYTTSESQRLVTLRRAAAQDIAMANLKKIGAKALIPATTPDCASGGGTIATNKSGQTPQWASAGLASEDITGTNLPTDTQQILTVSYPLGCATTMPAKITSTVKYSNESEVITREILIN